MLAAHKIQPEAGEHDEQTHQSGILQNEPEANGRHKPCDEKRRKAASAAKAAPLPPKAMSARPAQDAFGGLFVIPAPALLPPCNGLHYGDRWRTSA